jgi:hypothetical protein
MDVRSARAGRHVRGQPLDQPVHLGDGLGDRGQVLLAPAADLALEVVAALAVVARPWALKSTVCSAAITRFISS